MIDSNETMRLLAALEKFRGYISSHYDPDTHTAQSYLRTASKLEHYASSSLLSYEEMLENFYLLMTDAPALKRPSGKVKERYARVLFMINDYYYDREPKRKYSYRIVNCPASYQNILDTYQELMLADQKSEGTIRTRLGRIKIFFIFLSEHGCSSLDGISSNLFVEFISQLDGRYSSQGKASILYTVRNFFTYEMFLGQVPFDPFLHLTGLHSRKHERLASFYTAEEIRMVMNAVDRNTPWGKTIYLMMLLACVYGMRSSDIKNIKLDDINWTDRIIKVSQYKTKRIVALPLIEEVTYALLDYIKNVRPASDYRQVFIRHRRPYEPYSMNDHFGNKLSVYFKKAGINTEGKHHGLHSLRHSLAANLLADSTPVNEIAVILGHSSVASTRTYVWSDIEHLRNAALEVPYND